MRQRWGAGRGDIGADVGVVVHGIVAAGADGQPEEDDISVVVQGPVVRAGGFTISAGIDHKPTDPVETYPLGRAIRCPCS